MRRLIVLAAAILLVDRAEAQGQAPFAPTTVQLPTFHVFTVQTTVSVPDRGGMALGSISRGADGRVTLGPLGNRSSGGSRGASGVSATATIIDNHEIDKAILASGRATASDRASAKAAPIAAHVRTSAAAAPAGSVAAIRQQNLEMADERNAGLANLYANGQKAEAGGKASLARAYYGMVARQACGELKQQAEGRLAALAASNTATTSR
jgi:hypothetical protein